MKGNAGTVQLSNERENLIRVRWGAPSAQPPAESAARHPLLPPSELRPAHEPCNSVVSRLMKSCNSGPTVSLLHWRLPYRPAPHRIPHLHPHIPAPTDGVGGGGWRSEAINGLLRVKYATFTFEADYDPVTHNERNVLISGFALNFVLRVK